MILENDASVLLEYQRDWLLWFLKRSNQVKTSQQIAHRIDLVVRIRSIEVPVSIRVVYLCHLVSTTSTVGKEEVIELLLLHELVPVPRLIAKLYEFLANDQVVLIADCADLVVDDQGSLDFLFAQKWLSRIFWIPQVSDAFPLLNSHLLAGDVLWCQHGGVTILEVLSLRIEFLEDHVDVRLQTM